MRPAHVAMFGRNARLRPTAGIALLAAVIVVPILGITIVFVNDIHVQVAQAVRERAGIARLIALDRVLADASELRVAPDCGRPAVSSATVDTDVRAFGALEARGPFAGTGWAKAAAAWFGAGDAGHRAARLVDQVTPLFVTVSDRSGVTFDPDVAGIDLADALASRLPRASDALQRVDVLLCTDPQAPGEGTYIAVSRLSGLAEGFLSDAFGDDIGEAMSLDPSVRAAVSVARERAERSAHRALALLDLLELPSDVPLETSAQASTAEANRRLFALAAVSAPALDRIVVRRIAALQQRYDLTIVPGILATIAAALFIFFGARSVLERAELARVKRTAAELEHHATHDALTQLPNRTAFVTTLEKTIAAPAPQSAATVLFIDLDDFKLVNDSLGHAAGDVVLRAVADRLREINDSARGAIVARFGGDEFAMLVADGDPQRLTDRVNAAVGRISTELAAPIALGSEFDGRSVVISASVGIATIAGNAPQARAADMLRDADVAMYEAKSRGRARAATFGPAMHARAMRKFRLLADLRGATERGEFLLAREPIVRLSDGMTLGSEALIRWCHPRLGTLPPRTFLPLAEESGAIVQIGRWVLDAALGGLATPDEFIHVNLSVQELADETLPSAIAALLERHRIAPGRIAIEITEGSLLQTGGDAEAMVSRLRALGVQIWIDDFGIEYSSLRYIDRLPVDGVKIDRSFVSSTNGALASPLIVRMIVDLATSLDLAVIAEGVESAEQRDELIGLGCLMGQGFFYTSGFPRARSVHRGERVIPASTRV